MIADIIVEHVDKALSVYSQGKFHDMLVAAKKEYFAKTGMINDDDSDFEARMRMFNDWYLLHYITTNDTRAFIKKYLLDNGVEEDLVYSLLNVNFSLFEYLGHGMRSHVTCFDLIHKKKIQLEPEHFEMGLIKSDLFIGRNIEYKGTQVFLPGISVLPKEIKSILNKEARRIAKYCDSNLESDFLLKVEQMKSRWKSYSHLPAKQIFTFNT